MVSFNRDVCNTAIYNVLTWHGFGGKCPVRWACIPNELTGEGEGNASQHMEVEHREVCCSCTVGVVFLWCIAFTRFTRCLIYVHVFLYRDWFLHVSLESRSPHLDNVFSFLQKSCFALHMILLPLVALSETVSAVPVWPANPAECSQLDWHRARH